MSDLERLDEALEWVDTGPTVVGATHIIALADAARAYRDLLANGERVWWCDEHQGSITFNVPDRGPLTVCPEAEASGTGRFCRMVERLLVEPGEET